MTEKNLEKTLGDDLNFHDALIAEGGDNRLVYIADHHKVLQSCLIRGDFGTKYPKAKVWMEQSDAAIYVFQTPEHREIFEKMLRDKGISYSNEVPKEEREKYK